MGICIKRGSPCMVSSRVFPNRIAPRICSTQLLAKALSANASFRSDTKLEIPPPTTLPWENIKNLTRAFLHCSVTGVPNTAMSACFVSAFLPTAEL